MAKTKTVKTPVTTVSKLFPDELVSFGRKCRIDGDIEAASGLPFERWAHRLNDSDVLCDSRGRTVIAHYKLSHFEAIEPENAVGPDTGLFTRGEA
jgi:hypothetical protein